jgi:hypothetical protein
MPDDKLLNAARDILKNEIPDSLFYVDSYTWPGDFAVRVHPYHEDDGIEPLLMSWDDNPVTAVLEAAVIYREAVQAMRMRLGNADKAELGRMPTHRELYQQLVEMAQEDEDDYPTVELTQAQFDALPTTFSVPWMPGDTWRIPRADDPPVEPLRWFRTTVLPEFIAETRQYLKLHETIIIRPE